MPAVSKTSTYGIREKTVSIFVDRPTLCKAPQTAAIEVRGPGGWLCRSKIKHDKEESTERFDIFSVTIKPRCCGVYRAQIALDGKLLAKSYTIEVDENDLRQTGQISAPDTDFNNKRNSVHSDSHSERSSKPSNRNHHRSSQRNAERGHDPSLKEARNGKFNYSSKFNFKRDPSLSDKNNNNNSNVDKRKSLKNQQSSQPQPQQYEKINESSSAQHQQSLRQQAEESLAAVPKKYAKLAQMERLEEGLIQAKPAGPKAMMKKERDLEKKPRSSSVGRANSKRRICKACDKRLKTGKAHEHGGDLYCKAHYQAVLKQERAEAKIRARSHRKADKFDELGIKEVKALRKLFRSSASYESGVVLLESLEGLLQLGIIAKYGQPNLEYVWGLCLPMLHGVGFRSDVVVKENEFIKIFCKVAEKVRVKGQLPDVAAAQATGFNPTSVATNTTTNSAMYLPPPVSRQAWADHTNHSIASSTTTATIPPPAGDIKAFKARNKSKSKAGTGEEARPVPREEDEGSNSTAEAAEVDADVALLEKSLRRSKKKDKQVAVAAGISMRRAKTPEAGPERFINDAFAFMDNMETDFPNAAAFTDDDKSDVGFTGDRKADAWMLY